jgi:ribosome-associated protein
MEEIEIKTEYIELYKLLKFAGVAESGAQAKNMIDNAEVKVDGEVELRRGRKVRPGMIVTFDGAGLKVKAQGA